MDYDNNPSDEQLQSTFQTQGWAVVNGVFEADEAEAIATLAVEHVNVTLPVSEGADAGKLELRKVQQPFLADAAFARFALDPRLSRLLRILLKGKQPLLATDQIFLKPPKHGSAKPYHQDNAYFRCAPDDEVITAWIALDDVDESNGCLRYIDGSHLEPILAHNAVEGEAHNITPDAAQIDLSRESLGIVRKGGVVFHHSNILHTSHRNESDRWRRAYATHWVTPDVTCQSPVLDNAYFLRDDYASQ